MHPVFASLPARRTLGPADAYACLMTSDDAPETPRDDGRAGPAAPRQDRTLLVVLAVVALLVVAALVAVFARGATPQYDADSPQGTVQRYVTAVVTGDLDGARELHASKHDDCDPIPSYVSPDTRVTLVDSTESGDTATVTVRLSYGYDGPFGGDSGYEDRFELAHIGGEWLVSYSPWPFQVCLEVPR